jgi:hypothetical protein
MDGGYGARRAIQVRRFQTPERFAVGAPEMYRCGEPPSLPGQGSWRLQEKLLARQNIHRLKLQTRHRHQPAKWGTEDMAEGSGSQKVNPNLVAEIVSSYVAKNSVRRSISATRAVN